MKKNGFSDQIVFDLRTTEQKSIGRELISTFSFKKQFEVFEDKPQIIACDEVKTDIVRDADDEISWYPNSAVYDLIKQE